METPSTLDWDEILKRLQADRRDAHAWESLFDRGWPLVLATVARQSGAADSRSEDIAQEVFIRILKYCPFSQLVNAGSLRSYLTETARNTARDSRWSRAANPSTVSPMDADAIPDNAPSVELVAMARELLDQGILSRLNVPDRQIVEGLLDHRTLGEISRLTGLSYSAVGVRVHRLREEIRKSFGN